MKRLKQYRTSKKLSAQKIATLIGIPKSSYISYEQGYKTPSLKVLIKIASSLNLSLDYLLEQPNRKNIEIPKKITDLHTACLFLCDLNIFDFFKTEKEDKIITFAKLIHAIIINFSWR